MLLRNFYNGAAANTMPNPSYDGVHYGDGYLNSKTSRNGSIHGGTVGHVNLGNLTRSVSNYWDSGLSYNTPYICFGTGDTPVTYDDYTITITSVSTSNYAKGTLTYDSATNKWGQSVSMVLTNPSNTDAITIKEVGLMATLYVYSGWHELGLIYREVLTTPFTIQPNESVSYTHNFEFEMPDLS